MEARWLFLGLVCIGAAACASDPTPLTSMMQSALDPPAGFARRVSTPDVSVLWNCTQPEPGALQVEGVVQNTGSGTVRFAQVELVSVDVRDRTIASVRAAVPDQIIQMNQRSPFRLGLRTVGAEARVDLHYEYRLGSRFGAGGPDPSPVRFRARDVCSDVMHRVPPPQ